MLWHVHVDRLHAPRGGVTRRQALVLAGMAAGAALWPLGRGNLAWGAAGLHPRRAATYRELIGLLGRAPDPRFRRRAGAATRDFACWYERQEPAVRAHADAVLDALASGPAMKGSRLARAATPQGAAVVAAAMGLAAVSCDPPPDEDERRPAPALGAPA
jgi:hypothetical protein